MFLGYNDKEQEKRKAWQEKHTQKQIKIGGKGQERENISGLHKRFVFPEIHFQVLSFFIPFQSEAGGE
jgi:hypothetical protein